MLRTGQPSIRPARRRPGAMIISANALSLASETVSDSGLVLPRRQRFSRFQVPMVITMYSPALKTLSNRIFTNS